MTDDELAWATTDTGIDYSCPGFDVRRDEVRYPDGSTGEFHYVDESPAVVVLPFTPDGDVIAIREWRQAVDRVNRGLPAGSVEPEDAAGAGESAVAPADERVVADDGGPTEGLVAAAARELREETGYEAEVYDHLCSVEPVNGIADSVHHHFVARGCEPTAIQELDDTEDIAVDVVGYDDLLAAALAGELRDGRSVLALTRYELGRRDR